jgi:hypothetical protein
LGDGPTMKVVDLPKIYIFSFYRFSSCIQKVEVILNLQKLYFCPLFNSNPNFKNYSKSEFGSKTKVVEIKILNNFYFGNVLSFNTNLKIILQFPKKISFAGSYSTRTGFSSACHRVTAVWRLAAPSRCFLGGCLRG